jgi:hypothetical protein
MAIQLSLVGILVAGVFTNRLYGESIYWMCALGFALHRMRETALENEKGTAPPQKAKVVAAQVA